jgi:hypothetical protein
LTRYSHACFVAFAELEILPAILLIDASASRVVFGHPD